MSQKIYTDLDIKGNTTIGSIANATTDTDKFLVSDNGLVKYRTGAEMLSDLGVAPGVASNIQHQVKAGVAINKGQAVYVTSADGTNMIVGLASNTSEATSSKTMGLLASTVAINGFANVITEGLLAGLNTIGATAGDPVWLGTDGNLIYGLINKPSAPAHLVFIGIVTRVNASNGEIFVKVQNGFEFNEIHDVDLKTTTPVNGDILGFNGTLWVNKTIAAWLGYTPANASGTNATGNWGISITGNAATATKLQTARTLTIGNTGKTFDGSANVAWSLSEIGAQPAGSYAASSHTHDAADITSGTLSTARLSEFINNKYTYQTNSYGSGGGVYMPMVKGGLYASSTSTVTGRLRIKLPSYRTDMMISFIIDVYEYDTDRFTSYYVSGYNYSDAGATWYNTSAIALADSDNRNLYVRFGADTTNSFQCVSIGETDTSWTYPQVVIRDVMGGYSTETADILNTWTIEFVTTDGVSYSHSHITNQPIVDWSRIVNAPSTFTPSSHTHDDRYYTEGEVNSLLSGKADVSHNHTSLTGVTSIGFAAQSSDSASISTTIDGTSTFFDFNLTDDNNNDWWRWRFTPSGSTVYDAMTLKPLSNGNADLTISGNVFADNLAISNWNTAYGWGNHASAGYATQSWVQSQGYITGVTNISGYSGTLIAEDNRTIAPSELAASRMKFGFTSWNNNDTSPYADFIHLRSYQDSSGGSDNLVMFRKDAIGMRIYQQTFGSSTAYSSYKDVAFTDSSITGNAATATKLQTARTIGGVSFDGTANINLPGVNAAGNQSTTGNAATATTLQTARTLTIGNTGKTFDGSANVAWSLSEIGAQAALTNPITGTATSGQVAFFNGTTTQTGDTNLFWDNTNKRLGIGTTALGARLDVRAQGALDTDMVFRVRNSTDTQNFLVVNGAGDVYNRGAQGVGANTFFGEYVGRTSTGGYNSAFGTYSLYSNTTGAYNIAVGYSSLTLNTLGSFNTAVGTAAMYSNTSGNNNIAIGHNSLTANTSGNSNTAVGYNALISNTTGINNTALGHSAGGYTSGSNSNQTSNNSVYLGYNTRPSASGNTNEIVIGADAIGNGSNTVTLGNDSITKTVLKGDVVDLIGESIYLKLVTVTRNTILTNNFHNKIVRITASCTITIPAGLRTDFNCTFEVIGAYTAQFVDGSGATTSAPFGRYLKTDLTAMFYCTGTASNYRLNGSLTTS